MNSKQNNLSHDFTVVLDTEDLRKTFQEQVKARVQRMMQNKVEALFMSHNQIESSRKYGQVDKDAGLLRQQVDDLITDFALSPRFSAYVNKYCEEHFEERLRKACDQAMEHKANRLAHAFAKSAEV